MTGTSTVSASTSQLSTMQQPLPPNPQQQIYDLQQQLKHHQQQFTQLHQKFNDLKLIARQMRVESKQKDLEIQALKAELQQQHQLKDGKLELHVDRPQQYEQENRIPDRNVSTPTKAPRVNTDKMLLSPTTQSYVTAPNQSSSPTFHSRAQSGAANSSLQASVVPPAHDKTNGHTSVVHSTRAKQRVTSTLPVNGQLKAMSLVDKYAANTNPSQRQSQVVSRLSTVKPIMVEQGSLRQPDKMPSKAAHQRHISQAAVNLRSSSHNIALTSSINFSSLPASQTIAPPSVVAPAASTHDTPAAAATSPHSHRPRLFERFMIVGTLPTAKNLQSKHFWHDSPSILMSYPLEAANDPSINELTRFIFPNDVKVERLDLQQSTSNLMHVLYGQSHLTRGDSWYTFVIKTPSQTVADQLDSVYGCVITTKEVSRVIDQHHHMHDVVHERAYILFSRHSFFDLHFNLIAQMLKLLHMKRLEDLATVNASAMGSQPSQQCQLPQISEVEVILEQFYNAPIPQRGQTLTMALQSELQLASCQDLSYSRPHTTYDTAAEIMQWHAYLTFDSLTADVIVYIIELVLREFKVICVHESLAVSTASAMTLLSIVSPLTWVGVFLPSLPASLLELLDAPVPYLVGSQHLPDTIEHHLLGEHQAVFFPATNTIWLNHKFKPLMWQRSQLVARIDTALRQMRACRPDQRSVATLNYTPTAAEHDALDNLLTVIKTYVVDAIDYLHDTRVNHNPRKASHEPLASVLEHTQAIDWWFSNEEPNDKHALGS